MCLLVARTARILPGLRLHAFRGQEKMYSRRSASGKCSYSSPSSSRRSSIGRLHTLHLAKSPGGGVELSIHVWIETGQHGPLQEMFGRLHSTYWPPTYVGNRILNDFLRGVSEHDSGLSIVPLILEAGRVAIVGIHCGGSITVGNKQRIQTDSFKINDRESPSAADAV